MSSEVEATQLLVGDEEKDGMKTASLSSADRLLMDDLKLGTQHVGAIFHLVIFHIIIDLLNPSWKVRSLLALKKSLRSSEPLVG